MEQGYFMESGYMPFLQGLHLDECDPLIDLHTHTTASDGSMTPAELVRHASRIGLAAVAITDHDTVNGVGEALLEGKKLGVEVIPGVEISVDFSKWDGLFCSSPTELQPKDCQLPSFTEMHLLGYFPHGGYGFIQETLENLREKRDQRNPKIIGKLNEIGFDISMSEVNTPTAGGIIGRPHIAKVMADKGYVANIEEAFDKFLASGRPAYIRKEKLTPAEGICGITEAGGIPVLAHPTHLFMSRDRLDILLGQLAGMGLKGIEAYYTANTSEQTELFLKLARKHCLLVTGGSDFHGVYKPEIELGRGTGSLRVPYSVLERLKRG